MNRKQLIAQIRTKQSFLCVGLDTDPLKIPDHLKSADDPVFEFNREIIDATKDYCVAYKPNLAFYESLGPAGWISLQKTLAYIPENIFTIADAKRGDIGNTSSMYAKTFFEAYAFDAVTVAPYMGIDSVTPFLEFKNKWVILLALTSNKGANDFQMNLQSDGRQLYQDVIEKSAKWGSAENMMYVAGATRPEMIGEIRKLVPDHFLLVPGVGAQGGDLAAVAASGMNADCGLLVNASRSIIYADNSKSFADAAKQEAAAIAGEMHQLLKKAAILQ